MKFASKGLVRTHNTFVLKKVDDRIHFFVVCALLILNKARIQMDNIQCAVFRKGKKIHKASLKMKFKKGEEEEEKKKPKTTQLWAAG